MKVEVKSIQGVTVIRLRGSITINGGDTEMRQVLRDAVEAHSRRIVINLSRVSRIDASGIAELESACVAVSKSGGMLRLCGTSSNGISVLLTCTKIELFDNEEEAVGSFGSSRKED